MDLAASLKAQRELLNISQPDLAKAIGTSQQNVSRWESGQAVPGIDFCLKIAQFYEISLDELIGNFECKKAARDEMLLIQAYRAMSPGKKKALFNMLDLDEDAIQQNKIFNN